MHNIDCCNKKYINGDLWPPSFIDRLLGYEQDQPLVLKYRVRYFDGDGNEQEQLVKFSNFLENCGVVKDW